MDTTRNLIMTRKGDITKDVASCTFVPGTGKWHVSFYSGKEFDYNRNNLLCLQNPVRLDPNEYRVKANGKYQFNIQVIYVFKHEDTEYWHICYKNETEASFRKDRLQIERSITADEKAKQIIRYFYAVAGVVGVKDEQDENILVNKMNSISFTGDDTAAGIYLGAREYVPDTNLDASCPIFPFGCNESQFKAVTNALSNRISIIEGPPGTGKTQTILNIIANLVLQGKTVQVVSNNNAAIENVMEKLGSEKYGFGFITALLGKQVNKKAFIKDQTGEYPDLSSWALSESDGTLTELQNRVKERSGKLQRIYRDKNALAMLKQELSDVELEREHLLIIYLDLRDEFFKKPVSLRVLSKIRNAYADYHELDKAPGAFFILFHRLFHGVRMRRMMKADAAAVIQCLDLLFYELKVAELEENIRKLETKLQNIDAEEEIRSFTELSLKVFRAYLEDRYDYKNNRKVYDGSAISYAKNRFLSEYPVVLSTNYCARSNVHKTFDYVIMDEASQVDLVTGTIALSSARNAVIVGDAKQLSNVIKEKKEVQKITDRYGITGVYDFNKYSFLKSVSTLLKDRIPTVILREHYRCHPGIIGFCNRKFYDNNLIIMTENTDTEPLKLVETVPGRHARGRWNQRQIDVITDEVLPEVACDPSEVGIIAPYNEQTDRIRKTVKAKYGKCGYEAYTIHKFQGREKDTIIFSTTDDTVNEFSDESELLNVAISRAKNHLVIVASDKEQPSGSNMADLIGYIRYHNADVMKSGIRSVFDYLYKEYEKERKEYLKGSPLVSEYDSENLMYALVRKELDKRKDAPLGVLVHYPLVYLISDRSALTDEEIRFIDTGLSHVDLLIFNTISKQPVLAVEVDGVGFHKEDSKQGDRDQLKNHIMEVKNIPFARFKTNESKIEEKLSGILDVQLNSSY